MLTAKQEKFAQNIIQGMSQADAYRSAYDTRKMSDKTVHENASRLANNSKVTARVNELRGQIAVASIMTAQERLEYLTRVVRGEEKEIEVHVVEDKAVEVPVPASIKTRIDAIDKMNRMTGEYTQRVEANITYEDSLRKVVDEDEY